MHRSTLMHIYKFLLSLDRSELMCEHPLCNKEITSDSFFCCDSQRFNFIFTMTDWLPPDHSYTHTRDALSCAFLFKASYERKTDLIILMYVWANATETKSSKIASSMRFFIKTVCPYRIRNKLRAYFVSFFFHSSFVFDWKWVQWKPDITVLKGLGNFGC